MKIWLNHICLFSVLWVMAFAQDNKYTNQWVAKIHGGEEVAQRVARDLGYTYKEQITPFNDHYLLIRDELPQVSLRASHHLTGKLQDLDEVKWAEQQVISERSKRGFLPEYQERDSSNWDKLHGASNNEKSSGASNGLFNNDPPADPKLVGKANFKSIPSHSFSTKPAEDSQLNTYQGVTKHAKSLSTKKSFYEEVFNDPMWHMQWYVQDYRVKDTPVMDHNVVPVYKMGYTGKDIVVMITDDGVAQGHRDLVGNFDSSLSYDFCEDKPGCEPDQTQYGNSGGTMCAGIVAMVANNNKCGVGIAYHAKVAGAKALCSRYSPNSVPKGLVHQLEKADIYVNTWGAIDDGQTMGGMSKMVETAIDKGITEGRHKKGAIYVFAAGNGKHRGDNCAADGVANHVGNIVIGTANQLGKASFYSERCTAILATAYSGQPKMESVVTTTENGGCISTGMGSVTSVPMAAGIIALVLDAKSDLTYRDVMHLIVMSSEVAPLADNGEETWYKNGRNLWVSNDFGFGLLNAENMVNLAKHWKKVPKKHTCTQIVISESVSFSAQEGLIHHFDTKACHNKDHKEVKYLEQIELTSTISYPYRGAISISIKSPSGTKSTLLEFRPKDNNGDGLNAWTIKSVHNWGEDPRGRWTIIVKIANVVGLDNAVASAHKMNLTFHGTEDEPNHYKHPRKYAAFRLPDNRDSTN